VDGSEWRVCSRTVWGSSSLSVVEWCGRREWCGSMPMLVKWCVGRCGGVVVEVCVCVCVRGVTGVWEHFPYILFMYTRKHTHAQHAFTLLHLTHKRNTRFAPTCTHKHDTHTQLLTPRSHTRFHIYTHKRLRVHRRVSRQHTHTHTHTHTHGFAWIAFPRTLTCKYTAHAQRHVRTFIRVHTRTGTRGDTHRPVNNK
jgi:hypothetical protein